MRMTEPAMRNGGECEKKLDGAGKIAGTGYDTSSLDISMLDIVFEFAINDKQGFSNSMFSYYYVGAMLGGILFSFFYDFLGPRKTLIISDALFISSAACSYFSIMPSLLLCGRFCFGLGLGICTLCCPLMIFETISTQTRGKLIAISGLMMGLGSFLSYLFDIFVTGAPNIWHIRFGIVSLPALLQVLLVAVLSMFVKLSKPCVEVSYPNCVSSLFFYVDLKKALAASIFVQGCTELSGIKFVTVVASDLELPFLPFLVISGSLIGMVLVHLYCRKTILGLSIPFLAFILFFISLSSSGKKFLISLFIFTHTSCVGSISTVFTVEILPPPFKGFGGGITVCVQYLIGFGVTYFIQNTTNLLGNSTVAIVFASLSTFTSLIIIFWVPESKYVSNTLPSPKLSEEFNSINESLLIDINTPSDLRQALGERISPVNRMDRYFLELQGDGLEVYHTFDSIMCTYEDPFFGFSAGLHGWSSNQTNFAMMYASKFRVDEANMMELLLGEDLMGKALVKLFMNNWLPASSALSHVVVFLLPSRAANSDLRNSIAEVPFMHHGNKVWAVTVSGNNNRWTFYVNRMDRCFLELQGDGVEVYHTFRSIMCTYEDPFFGFSAGLHGWSSNQTNFAMMYASKFRVDEANMMELLLGEHLMGKALMQLFMKNWLPASSALSDVVVFFLPSHAANSDVRSCIAEVPFMHYGNKVWAVAVSGNTKRWTFYVKILLRNEVWMGKRQETIEDVPCGNTVATVGLNQYKNNATLTDEKEVIAHPIHAMELSMSSELCVAVQCKVASDLPKLVEGLKRLAKAYPLVVSCFEESGEHIIAGAGEADLDEGCVGPRDDSRGSKILSEEFGWDKYFAKKIWCFGPETTGPNMLVDV